MLNLEQFQKTALHAAAERGHTPVLRILVNTDLDVNVRDMVNCLFCLLPSAELSWRGYVVCCDGSINARRCSARRMQDM